MTQAHPIVDISDTQQQAPTGTSRRPNDTLVDRPTAGIRWRPLRQSPRKQVINIAELPPSVPPLRQQQPKPPRRRQQRNPHQNAAVTIQQQVDLGELLQRLSAAEAERDRLSDLVARAEQPPSRTTEVDTLKSNVDELRRQQDEAQVALRDYQKQLGDLLSDREQLRLELNGLKERLETVKESAPALPQQQAPDQLTNQTLESLRNEMNRLNSWLSQQQQKDQPEKKNSTTSTNSEAAGSSVNAAVQTAQGCDISVQVEQSQDDLLGSKLELQFAQLLENILDRPSIEAAMQQEEHRRDQASSTDATNASSPIIEHSRHQQDAHVHFEKRNEVLSEPSPILPQKQQPRKAVIPEPQLSPKSDVYIHVPETLLVPPQKERTFPQSYRKLPPRFNDPGTFLFENDTSMSASLVDIVEELDQEFSVTIEPFSRHNASASDWRFKSSLNSAKSYRSVEEDEDLISVICDLNDI